MKQTDHGNWYSVKCINSSWTIAENSGYGCKTLHSYYFSFNLPAYYGEDVRF